MKVATFNISKKAVSLHHYLKVLMVVVLIGTKAHHSSAQTDQSIIDSLQLVLKTTKDDTTRCNTLARLFDEQEDKMVSPDYIDQLKSICEKNLKSLKPADPLYSFYTFHLSTAYGNMGFLYAKSGDPKKAIQYEIRSIRLLKSLIKTEKDQTAIKKIYENIGTGLSNIGIDYMDLGETKLMFQYFENSLKIQRLTGNKESEMNVLGNMALAYSLQGNFSKALEYNMTCLKYWESVKDKDATAVILVNIGAIFHNQKEFSKALEYFDRAQKIYQELGDTWTVGAVFNNIGHVYLEQGKLDQALQYFQKAKRVSEGFNNLNNLGNSIVNIGSVHSEMIKKNGLDPQKRDSLVNLALSEYASSLELQEQIWDKERIVNSLINTANLLCLYRPNELKKAQELAEKAEAISRRLGYPEKTQKVSEILSRIYSKQGDYKKAYEMQVLFKQMSDSINNEANRKALTQKTMQYEFDKKEASQKAEHEKEVALIDAAHKNTRNLVLFISAFVLLLLIAAFVFYNIRKNLKIKTENMRHLLSGQEKERQRISKELHDGVGQHILFLRNQLVKLNQEPLVASADETLEEVRTLSKNLYPNQLEKYGLIAAVDALISRIGDNTGMFASHDLEAFEQDLTQEQQIGFYRIIQECVSNALKHASATALRVTATTIGKSIELVIQDDGKGFDKNILKQKAQSSFGVLNLEERVRAMGGSTSLETSPGNGTKWTFHIPL